MTTNVNSPFGFRHIGSAGGANPNFSDRHAKVAYDYGIALFKDDVMVDNGSGYVVRYSTGVTGSNVAGVVKGFKYLSSATGEVKHTTYLPVGDTAYDVEVTLVPINGVPPQRFLVQASATQFTAADIGQTIEPAVGGTGTNVSGHGVSAMAITQGTNQGTDNTKPFRIVGFLSDIAPTGTNGTDNTASYNIVMVESNPYEATGV